jgi:hypothetical protein
LVRWRFRTLKRSQGELDHRSRWCALLRRESAESTRRERGGGACLTNAWSALDP